MGFFDKNQQLSTFTFLGNDNFTIKSFGNDVSMHPIVASCVDCIAKHCAKASFYTEDGQQIDFLKRPNEYQSQSSFIYKIVANLKKNNECFVYIDRNKRNKIKALHVLNHGNCQIKVVEDELLFEFLLPITGTKKVVPYSEIIHIRDKYMNNEFYGDDQQETLKNLVNTKHTLEQGIEKYIHTSNLIRGIVQVNAILKNEDLQKYLKDFNGQFDNLENKSSFAVLDNKASFTPISSNAQIPDHEIFESVNREIYSYFGLTQEIVENNASNDSMEEFYDSVIAPILKQISEEFSDKLNMTVALTLDNYIFASFAKKISAVKEMVQFGILSIDESRQLLGYGKIPGGEKRLQTLNVVNADLVDAYQMNGIENKSQNEDQMDVKELTGEEDKKEKDNKEENNKEENNKEENNKEKDKKDKEETK